MENSNKKEAIAHIRSQKGNPTLYKVRHRGFLDWKFSELAEYKGYDSAVEYAESVLKWHDAQKYAQCLLITTYQAFRAAEAHE